MNIADVAAIVNSGGGGGGGGAGGGYDFIIKNDVTTSTAVLSLDKGDFDAVAEKLNNRKPVNAFLYSFNQNTTGIGVTAVYGGADYNAEDDQINTYWYSVSNISRQFTIVWTRDGTIFED